jgi:hypothetical protein
MEKMTIHRGLAELKLIDARIEKEIEQTIPSGIAQKGKKVNNIFDETDFTKNAQAGFDSVLALIKRKNTIKCAIVKKNAETKVIIDEKEMTIADAINFKTLIEYKKKFIASLFKKHNTALANLEKTNAVVDQNLQAVLVATFGKAVKTSDTDMESVRKPFMESNEFHLIDPLKIIDKLAVLEKEVVVFETEVDAVLSEINAITFIEFE